jgi:hypothetical protein
MVWGKMTKKEKNNKKTLTIRNKILQKKNRKKGVK